MALQLHLQVCTNAKVALLDACLNLSSFDEPRWAHNEFKFTTERLQPSIYDKIFLHST